MDAAMRARAMIVMETRVREYMLAWFAWAIEVGRTGEGVKVDG